MAGVTPPTKPNRHQRRAAAAAEPAIEASADRAAAEDSAAAAAIDPSAAAPVVPPADLPLPDTTVVPEPTLVAEPGAPQPIVTASPILAVEPSAIDVVQADAAADRAAAGIGPAPEPEALSGLAAGQPTLTIEGSAADRVAARLADWGAEIVTVEAGTRQPVGEVRANSFLLADLTEVCEILMDRDPDGFAELLRRLGVDRATDRPLTDMQPAARWDDIVGDRDLMSDRPKVSVIEVVGPPAGRRRANMTFGPVARVFLADELGPDELAALHADPLLAVGMREVDEAEARALLSSG